MRWMWIDRFVTFESGKSATAVKNLSLAEDHFADHFPGFPVMPAPLILEGLAQTGGILVGEANKFDEKVVLAKMSAQVPPRRAGRRAVDVHDRRPRPDDTGARVSATAHSGPDLVAEAEILFAHVTAAPAAAGAAGHQVRLQRRADRPARARRSP